MAVLDVARMGNPILRRTADKVNPSEIETPEFQKFIDDMIETMRSLDGVGLAAPQVERSQRIAVIEIPADSERYPGGAELHVFINPQVSVTTDEQSTYWEGCLSVPGLRGLVARPNKVKVKFLDRKGKPQELRAEGFLATVLQHEFDHLDGKLYIDRLVDSTKLVFEEEYEKFIR